MYDLWYGRWLVLIMLLLSSLPVIVVYIWYRFAKYQISLIQFLFILLAGASAFFPALVLQYLLSFSFPTSGRLALFYNFFVRVAFTEELSRLLALIIFFWISGRIKPDERSGADISWSVVKKGTAAGLVAGLGFAILENAVYASSNPHILLLRAVTAAPLHAACGSRVGAAAVMLRSNPVQAVLRLFTATAIHGIYNLMVTRPGFPAIMAILIALSALFTAISTIHNGWETRENSTKDFD